jgi:cyanophycinase
MLLVCRLIAIVACCVPAQAQTPSERGARIPIDPAGCAGTLVLGGGGSLPGEVYERFIKIAGGVKSRVALVPTASSRADTEAGRQKYLERWQKSHPGISFSVLHTRDRTEADTETFCLPLKSATAIWFGGGSQQRIADAYVGTRFEREVHALLTRGGVVGGSSAGTAIQTRTMIKRGKETPELSTGLDLVPLAIADQHFLKRNRLPRLIRALELCPGHFGLGIDEGTAAFISGRSIRVIGKSEALLVLAKSDSKPQRIVRLKNGGSCDLVTWQRAARQRATISWPPAKMASPSVANGTLMLGGGGRLPRAVFTRFVTLAGGKKACIVVAPTASPRREGESENRIAVMLRRMGAQQVVVLQPRHPSEVTKEHIDLLNRATGVWFGGGRQWRTVDAFADTPIVAAMHRVLKRGGVIAGSSAGATIQGELLVRGNPQKVIFTPEGRQRPGNTDMWCEGYDRGFAFLPGCAVDQHFVARNRLQDLQHVIDLFPQVIGIGVDEGACAVVSQSTLEVIGTSKVGIVDARRNPARPILPAWLAPGDRWDLAKGQRLPN